MKKQELESVGDVAMREIGLEYLKKGLAIFAWLAIAIALALLVVWLTGCATTTQSVRAATTEEAAQYGLGPGATRYEYPDAVVFSTVESTSHPEVEGFRGNTQFSSDRVMKDEFSGVIRMVDTARECISDTDKCAVTVRETVFVMRPEPNLGMTWGESSEVTVSLSSSWGMATMLVPTELALRALVLEALWLRNNPPSPTDGCEKWTTNDDDEFIDAAHFQHELRATRLLEVDGYVPLHAVKGVRRVFSLYERAARGCLTPETAVVAANEGSRLIAEILGSVVAEPNL